MRVKLLSSQLRELEIEDIDPSEAFRRGVAALGEQPAQDGPLPPAGTRASVEVLAPRTAETIAGMYLLEFSFAQRAETYEASIGRYDAVEQLSRSITQAELPVLRARLRALRAEEAQLEAAMRDRGMNPDEVGPSVPDGEAIDPSPRPGEAPRRVRALAPLEPSPSLLQRAVRLLRR